MAYDYLRQRDRAIEEYPGNPWTYPCGNQASQRIT